MSLHVLPSYLRLIERTLWCLASFEVRYCGALKLLKNALEDSLFREVMVELRELSSLLNQTMVDLKSTYVEVSIAAEFSTAWVTLKPVESLVVCTKDYFRLFWVYERFAKAQEIAFSVVAPLLKTSVAAQTAVELLEASKVLEPLQALYKDLKIQLGSALQMQCDEEEPFFENRVLKRLERVRSLVKANGEAI